MMRTKVNLHQPAPVALQTAAHVLKTGGIIAFPSDSAYGLGVNIFDQQAVEKLFKLKQRPKTKPLSALAAGFDQACRLAKFTPEAENVWSRLMPGPLTFILPRHKNAPDWLGGSPLTIGLRYPDTPLLHELGRLTPPFTTTSANISGQPTCYSPNSLISQFGDQADQITLILDAGPLPTRPTSTVLDLTQSPPKILRPGPLTQTRLQSLTGLPIT